MKIRIYFRPSIVVFLMGLAAALLWCAMIALGQRFYPLTVAVAVFYTLLFVSAAWALWRVHVLERSVSWDSPARLLILAPHEDDCAIAAGGIGACNQRLGGATRIVYLARDESGIAERRAAEARAAWREADLDSSNLQHLDLLPPLRQRDPRKLREVAATLRSIIDDFKPTVVIVPMFEGGHIHHDMTAALITSIVSPEDRFDVFEAPEYGPYVSLQNTPHRVIALTSRWLFGLLAYYGPPDGVDSRPIYKFRLDPVDLMCKRRMLAAFTSQNVPSLVATKSYPDRLVRLDTARRRRQPFDFRHSYLRFALAVHRLLPVRIVERILPVQRGTIGREGTLTDWHDEWEIDPQPSAERR
jgi:LmbE family N-acetylglucosaminyl deacetylase